MVDPAPAARSTHPDPLDELLEELANALPAFVWSADRDAWRVVGLSPKTLQNLVSLGQGPGPVIRLGRRVGWRRRDLLAWLRGRLTVGPDLQERRTALVSTLHEVATKVGERKDRQ